jgi:hypothetical protein
MAENTLNIPAAFPEAALLSTISPRLCQFTFFSSCSEAHCKVAPGQDRKRAFQLLLFSDTTLSLTILLRPSQNSFILLCIELPTSSFENEMAEHRGHHPASFDQSWPLVSHSAPFPTPSCSVTARFSIVPGFTAERTCLVPASLSCRCPPLFPRPFPCGQGEISPILVINFPYPIVRRPLFARSLVVSPRCAVQRTCNRRRPKDKMRPICRFIVTRSRLRFAMFMAPCFDLSFPARSHLPSSKPALFGPRTKWRSTDVDVTPRLPSSRVSLKLTSFALQRTCLLYRSRDKTAKHTCGRSVSRFFHLSKRLQVLRLSCFDLSFMMFYQSVLQRTCPRRHSRTRWRSTRAGSTWGGRACGARCTKW